MIDQPLISFGRQLRDRLKLSGLDARRLRDEFGTLRTSAIRRRVTLMFDAGAAAEPSFADARRAILPQVPDYVSTRRLDHPPRQYDRAPGHAHPDRPHPPAHRRPRFRPPRQRPHHPRRSAGHRCRRHRLRQLQAREGRGGPHHPALDHADERRLYPHFALAVASMYPKCL